MQVLILFCGFFGAWLLVAGPLYQAALELNEEDIERDDLEAAMARSGPQPRVSPWWWLLPPVGYWLHRRQARRGRAAVMAVLTAEELESFVQFANKATGWALVAAGAGLIAAKETWELVEHFEWPVFIFWMLMVVMAVLSAVYTAARMVRSKQMLGRA